MRCCVRATAGPSVGGVGVSIEGGGSKWRGIERGKGKWGTVNIIVRTLSSKLDVLTASWWAFGAPASSLRTNRVPIHTALAPSMSAAAND